MNEHVTLTIPVTPPERLSFEVPGKGRFIYEVEGETSYQDAVATLALLPTTVPGCSEQDSNSNCLSYFDLGMGESIRVSIMHLGDHRAALKIEIGISVVADNPSPIALRKLFALKVAIAQLR